MPERGFNTGFWTDPFVVKLPFEAKGLYAYLWTNDHCNQAGLYEIATETIASETKIPEDSLPSLLKSLSPKVEWYPEQNLIWVKNFIKRQSKSPKFLVAVAKSLSSLYNNGAVKALIEYNRARFGIEIPYHLNSKETRIENSDTITLSTISKTYESNIGPITPLIGDKLKEIAENYSSDWFVEAVKEACQAGVRKLNYIEAILQRWKTDGFKTERKGVQDGKTKSNTKQGIPGNRPAGAFADLGSEKSEG